MGSNICVPHRTLIVPFSTSDTTQPPISSISLNNKFNAKSKLNPSIINSKLRNNSHHLLQKNNSHFKNFALNGNKNFHKIGENNCKTSVQQKIRPKLTKSLSNEYENNTFQSRKKKFSLDATAYDNSNTKFDNKNLVKTKQIPFTLSSNSIDNSSCSSVLPLDSFKSFSMNKRLMQFSKTEKSSLLNHISIDTSRAKSNAHVVSICAQKLQMIEYKEPREDGQPCNIYWHNIAYSDMRNVVKGCANICVNRFPGMTELSKKVALTQAVRSMKQLFPNEYRFYPNSWILPAQLEEFREHCMRSTNNKRHSLASLISHCSDETKHNYYIVKPDDGAQGTGIYLIRSVEELHSTTDRQLIQEYIAKPFLLNDQLKFDFRVYAVIRSINPLSVYIAREGMARFCTEKYEEPKPENFENLFSHLTNYSLNKANNSYIHSKSLKDQLQGSKRLLSTVFHQMESRGMETRKLWHDIKMIVVRTVLAMVPEIMLNYEHYFAESVGPQCFQIMGFDIIVQSDGVPILLEVNAAPSLSIEHINGNNSSTTGCHSSPPPVRSIVDEMIKVPLVHDCLLLVSNQLQQNRSYHESSDAASIFSKTKTDNTILSYVRRKFRDTEDDLSILKKKKKPHLSEIFPGRYGEKSRHLLVLDRAVYLFMQFVNVKQTLLISLPGLKAFLRKCKLTDVINAKELVRIFSLTTYYFTGSQTSHNQIATTPGVPFHGFLQILFHIAQIKFENCKNLTAFLRLLTFCDSTLRYYGVRSARLRRTELEQFDSENNHFEIYLLPNRIQQQTQRHKLNGHQQIDGIKHLRSRTVSVPKSRN